MAEHTEVPNDFTYPWGEYWHGFLPLKGWNARTKTPRRPKPKFARKMSAHDRKMLDRITGNKTRYTDAELGIHPDQPHLEKP